MAGSWEKTKHPPRRTLSKNRGHASGTSERKNPREPIAPSPHRFVFLLEVWVHSLPGSSSGALQAKPSARRAGDFSLTPPLVWCCYSRPQPRFTTRRFETTLSCRCGGPPARPATTMLMRWRFVGGPRKAQSQDRGTWRRPVRQLSCVCLLTRRRRCGQRGPHLEPSWATESLVCCSGAV